MIAARLPFVSLLLGSVSLLAGCVGGGGTSTPDRSDVAGWVERVLVAEDVRDVDDPILPEALRHDEPAVRFAAYRALARIGDAAAIPMLVDALGRETVPQLRSEAIFAIGRTEHPSIVDVVERFILVSDDRTRADLARALGMSGDERGLISLLDSIDDPSPAVRGAAALALGRMLGGRPGALEGRAFGPFRSLGERMVHDESAEVRWRAVHAGGKLGAEAFRPRFLQALADPDPRVRLFAAEALAAMPGAPPAETVAALVETLGDPDWRVVVEAAKGLDGVDDEAARSALVAIVGAGDAPGHPSPHARAAAAASLGAEGAGPEVVDALVSALADPSDSVRGAAADGLAVVLPPAEALARYRAVLAIEGAAGPSKYLRSRLARAAAALPDGAGHPLVVTLLDDPDLAVRTAALAALGGFPDRAEEADPWLEDALATREVALREAAATSAGALGRTELVPALVDALDDSPGPDFVETRISIVKALGALGGRAAFDALGEALRDDERQVRLQARAELARLGGSIPKLPRRPPPERVIVPRYGVDFTYEASRPRVRLVTNRGPFELELMPDEAPHHALLFLERCRAGFYDGLTFHRMVPGFVIQGLDPRGDGYGTGGASLRSEVNPIRYASGVVGMPDAGLDTGGCQIFVTFRPQPRLDARYTVFARVVAGMDVVEALDVGDRVDYVIVESPSAP